MDQRIQAAVYFANLRAKQAGLQADLTIPQWANLLEQSHGYCSYCHRDVGIKYLVLDHIIPLAQGGETTLSNVTPACKKCNGRKCALMPDEWALVLNELRK